MLEGIRKPYSGSVKMLGQEPWQSASRIRNIVGIMPQDFRSLEKVFMFTSPGILACSLSKSEESASVVGNVITFPMMFLSGTFFPIAIMPDWLQTYAHVLPLFYIIDGLNSITIYTNYSSALLDITVSVAVAVVIFVLMVLKFSWKE